MANMPADLILDFKDVTPEADIIEMVVWRVPVNVPPTTHAFKCRLAFVRAGKPLVGFDNERGKGDHFHVGGREHPYAFVSLERLVEDFIAEIAKWRK
jgi:hypothetical protein